MITTKSACTFLCASLLASFGLTQPMYGQTKLDKLLTGIYFVRLQY